EGPAVGADDPRDRDARAFVREIERILGRLRAGLAHVERAHAFALAIDERERTAAAIELLAALAEAEDRAVPEREADVAIRAEAHVLAGPALLVRDGDRERVRRHANPAFAPLY